MEQDYSIDRDFLSKINNAMTIKAKEMPLPAVVQVGDVEKMDGRLNLLELCDGEHIMSHLGQNVGVLTRHEEVTAFHCIILFSKIVHECFLPSKCSHRTSVPMGHTRRANSDKHNAQA